MLPRFIDSAAAWSRGQQRLNNVDPTHLLLASGKLVLQKASLAFTTYFSSDKLIEYFVYNMGSWGPCPADGKNKWPPNGFVCFFSL